MAKSDTSSDDDEVIISRDLQEVGGRIGVDPEQFMSEMTAAGLARFRVSLPLDVVELAAVAGAARAALVWGKPSEDLAIMLSDIIETIVELVEPSYPNIARMLDKTAIPPKEAELGKPQ